ncbi:MAG: hypothetical protein ACPK7O_02535 [Methanobacterium sp.]
MFNTNFEDGKKFFQKMINDENTMTRMNNIFKKANERINFKHKTEFILGKPIRIDNKIFHPIVEMITFESLERLSSTEITPIALVVEENDNEYLISFTEEENDPQELIKMLSGEENSEKVIELLRKMI